MVALRCSVVPRCTRRRARARVNDDDNPFFTESDKNHPGNSPKANEGTRTITPPRCTAFSRKLLKMNWLCETVRAAIARTLNRRHWSIHRFLETPGHQRVRARS
uniref:Uncharacterized protein n=1 Tax=Sipha flava TaxID=143950 RepID=A0A2S2RA57_9HEMI